MATDTNARHALRKSIHQALGESIPLPAPYAPRAFPVLSQRRRIEPGSDGYVLVASMSGTPTVVGQEMVQQVDVFTPDGTAELGEVCGVEVSRLLLERERGAAGSGPAAGSVLPVVEHAGRTYVFTHIIEALSLDQTEEGAGGQDVRHVILQFRVRAQRFG
jgi:hypothetical protein